MKALILCAGMGTRLSPLTDTRPKALVKINGTTLLKRVITAVQKHGYDELVINLHHFGHQIIDYMDRNGNFGCRVEYSDESESLLDTGGALRKAASLLNSCPHILIHNVDIICDIDLGTMRAFHEASGALATLAVKRRETSRYFLFDGNMRLKAWKNIKSGELRGLEEDDESLSPFAFSGIQLVDTRIFDLIEEEGKFSLTELYLRLCKTHPVLGYIHQEGLWSDAGSPEALKNIAEREKKPEQKSNKGKKKP